MAIIVFVISINTIICQPYQIGHVTISFTDTSRNERQIPVEVYYPALTGGEEVPVAPGQFPVISYGHGFVMNVGSYVNFSEVLVPEGYILAFSDTETGFSPSHEDLALDLAFILHAFREEGSDPGSLFSGSGDCVTPPVDHQEPMYDSLASACKTWISITGGGHCYFANENFLCTFGEHLCIEGDYAIKQLYINDLSGRQIFRTEECFRQPLRINTQSFSTGIYQIVIISSTGERMNLKGIKL